MNGRFLFIKDEKIVHYLNSISEGIQILDGELRYLYLNDACVNQAGLKREDLIGKRMVDVYNGIEKTELYKRLTDCLINKAKDEIENEFTYPDGKKGWFLLIIEPFEDGLIIFSTDISQVKEKEKRIVKLNRLLKCIKDINQLIIREKDIGRLINSATSIIGESRLFKAAFILIERENKIKHFSIQGENRITFAIGKMIQSGSFPECIKKVRGARILIKGKGNPKNCGDCKFFESVCNEGEYVILPITYGLKYFGFMMIIANEGVEFADEDVSLIKEISDDLGYSIYSTAVEYEYGRSIRLIEKLMENIKSIVSILGSNNEIKYINPFIKNFGFDDKMLIGRSIFDTIISSDKNDVIKAISSMREGKSQEFIFHITDNKKMIHTFRARGTILSEENKEDVILLILDDITEQRLIEQQMYSAQRLESVGRLAGGVAHDFNNLLFVILNYVDFAIKEVEKETKIYEYLNNIREASIRASDLTRQLLSFSRRDISEKSVIDINTAIKNIIKLVKRIIGENIDIEFIESSNIKPVLMDPGHFDQILMNLIVNAKDAMPAGGKIIINTDIINVTEDYNQQRISLKKGSYSIVSITDTGVGMDDSILKRIFEPFFTTKDKDKGTGLGLSTVYGLVKRYMGEIFVYSEVNRGTIFKIYLPSFLEEEQKGDETVIIEARGGDETILLVEDDALVRDITLKMLKDAGYNVLVASSPADAIKLVDDGKERIDLLLSDIVMPEMSGIDLAEKIVMKIPDIKILFMSGYTEQTLAYHKILGGFINLIQKPFDSNTLNKKLRELLDKKL